MSDISAEQRKELIAAYLYERAGNIAKGWSTDEIDNELARLGHDASPPQKRAVKLVKPKATEL